MYNTMYAAASPYGETVPIEDLQEIYRKGTMYDLEYLFKTINGPDNTLTNIATSSLSGTITNAQLAGSIATSKLAGSITNAKLSNSTISKIIKRTAYLDVDSKLSERLSTKKSTNFKW